MKEQQPFTLIPGRVPTPDAQLHGGPNPGPQGKIPGLGRGADLPAKAGRACQGHLQLGHQHEDLRPMHEAQPIVYAHAQAPLQDLQGANVQRAARLEEHRVRPAQSRGGSPPEKPPAERPTGRQN